MSHATESRPRRIVLLAFLNVGYILTLYLFFRPVQMRIWNDFSAVDVFLMACLILPFMVVPVLVRPRHGVTRYAWGVTAVMALDLVFFAAAEFGPLGSGHPSLESLASYTSWRWPSRFSCLWPWPCWASRVSKANRWPSWRPDFSAWPERRCTVRTRRHGGAPPE